MHGTDLALAIGREPLVDEGPCRDLLATMRGMDFDVFRRPGMFGPPLPAADDAPAHRRLAFLGRDLTRYPL